MQLKLGDYEGFKTVVDTHNRNIEKFLYFRKNLKESKVKKPKIQTKISNFFESQTKKLDIFV